MTPPAFALSSPIDQTKSIPAPGNGVALIWVIPAPLTPKVLLVTPVTVTLTGIESVMRTLAATADPVLVKRNV